MRKLIKTRNPFMDYIFYASLPNENVAIKIKLKDKSFLFKVSRNTDYWYAKKSVLTENYCTTTTKHNDYVRIFNLSKNIFNLMIKDAISIDIINIKNNKIIKEILYGKSSKKITIGAELEFQCENSNLTNNYIEDIGRDSSIEGNGIEVRTIHPTISYWSVNKTKQMFDVIKESGAKEHDSCGLHIHIAHKEKENIAEYFRMHLQKINDLLLPISYRPAIRANGNEQIYGVKSNIYRNQIDKLGTVELRCFSTTLDVKLFIKRIKFTKMLYDFLATNPNDIWNMPEKLKKLYVNLLFDKRNTIHTKNHLGLNLDQVKKLLKLNNNEQLQEAA